MRMHVMAYSAPMASLLNITLTGSHSLSFEELVPSRAA